MTEVRAKKIRDIDFSVVARALSRNTLLMVLNEIMDEKGFSMTWESADVAAVIKSELEGRDAK